MRLTKTIGFWKIMASFACPKTIQNWGNPAAVRGGLTLTGPTITAAGLIMAIAFGGLLLSTSEAETKSDKIKKQHGKREVFDCFQTKMFFIAKHLSCLVAKGSEKQSES